MPCQPDSTLTPTALANHLACRHLTQLDRARRELGVTIEFRRDPRAEAMRQRGAAHERAFVQHLIDSGKRVFDLRAEAGHHDDTLRGMRQGHDALVQAPLASRDTVGIADVLVRVDTPSELGAWSYEPYDTKLARQTKAGTLLQLATYAEMLAGMQGRTPDHVHVVTPLTTEPYRTVDLVAYARRVRRQWEDARVGAPRHAVCPDPVPHCDICGYFTHCDRARRAVDHPSFVAGLGTRHVAELHRQGIDTLAQLAASEGALQQAPRRGHLDTYKKLAAQAALQVAARTTGRIPVVHLAFEPMRGLCRLPAPSSGDVFLDFEGDPFVGDGGREYLTGWLLADGSYTARWALDAAAERTAIEALLDTLAERLAQHDDLHIYHFGHYEPTAIKRLVQRHGTRAEFLDGLLRGERFVDLHAVVREGLRIGVERYGLKELEPVVGFVRALDLTDAARARHHVEIALELGDLAALDDEVRARVTDYNREDCASTRALRDWLERQRTQALQCGVPLLRPTHKGSAPTAQLTEREQRIVALASALVADLPADVALRSDEQGARALLADQLAYFRREAKSAWWEFFRLRELELEELIRERAAIGGLRFEPGGLGDRPAMPPNEAAPLFPWKRELPKHGKDRSASCEYSFPPQETAVDVGDEVYPSRCEDPASDAFGTKLGRVVSCDPEAGTVVVKHTTKAAHLRPTALLEFRNVPSSILEDALVALGERVRGIGCTASGAFAAACDLLLRRLPRVDHAGQPLQRPGENSRDAAVRLCRALDGGVLPIQGPPGSGKSTLGAEVILRLVSDGKRVGVTAVSHAVIDGVLKKVRDLAPAAHVAVRLVHKDDNAAEPGIDYVAQAADALAAIAPDTVVGGTAWLWASADARAKLDYLFVDEAGQMSLAQVLAAATSAHNLVLLGDPQQLEQPRKGAHPEGSDIAALVHVLGHKHQTMPPERGLFLPQTHRLHPTLCAFTSEMFYDGKLHAAPNLERQSLGSETPFAGAGLFLVEVKHEGNQAVAHEEVDQVVAIARLLLHKGATWTDAHGDTRPLTPSNVVVVAPYNAQVAALRRNLAPLGVTGVGTVDKFQGQEAPIVIYSCTSSSAHDAPRGMNFLYDPHRFNVATSRARSTVIVVGSPALFAPECRTPEQVKMANALCRFRELAKVVAL